MNVKRRHGSRTSGDCRRALAEDRPENVIFSVQPADPYEHVREP